MTDYAGDLRRLCDKCVHLKPLRDMTLTEYLMCEACDGQEYFETGGREWVYIVLQGEDCEGASVKAVFATEDQAVQYVKENYARYEKTGPRRWHYGCDYIEIEEWELTWRYPR